MSKQQEYLIETRDAPGQPWFIIDSAELNHNAQGHMRNYQQQYPHTAFRVVEHPSCILQVCVCAEPLPVFSSVLCEPGCDCWSCRAKP